MLTRTLTVAGNPQIQVTLHYSSRSNAEKPTIITPDGEQKYVDDYGQIFVVSKDIEIITDLITDVNEMFAVTREMQLAKIRATKKMQDMLDADPLLKVWMEAQRRGESTRGGVIIPPDQNLPLA